MDYFVIRLRCGIKFIEYEYYIKFIYVKFEHVNDIFLLFSADLGTRNPMRTAGCGAVSIIKIGLFANKIIKIFYISVHVQL